LRFVPAIVPKLSSLCRSRSIRTLEYRRRSRGSLWCRASVIKSPAPASSRL
jgi:hypothetical protein